MRNHPLALVLLGVAVVVAWYWLEYVALGGLRSQRRAAWLRPALGRRLRRAARRKDRALDREIRVFLGVTPGKPARDRRTAEVDPVDPDADPNLQPRPAHRRPGSRPE